jgi:hypothetical protein
MILRLVLPAVAAAALVMAVAGSAGAENGTAACQLAGTATLTPGLKVTPATVKYTFKGTLTGCRSSNTSITSGTVTATGGGTNVSCGGGITNGKATIAWNTGTKSVLSFQTTGLAASVTVTGTVASGQFAGSPIAAQLVFQANPTLCNSATGVKTVPFQGVTL